MASNINDHFNKPISKEKLKDKSTDWSGGLESDLIKQNRANLAIDWEHLHQISDGDEDFERELLQIFVEDAHNHLEEAQVALLAGDYDWVSRTAHHVKGASAIAGKLETDAHAKRLSEAAVMLAELAELLQDVQTFLDQA